VSSLASPPANRTRLALTITAVIVAVLVILFFIFSSLYADVLWFDQLGYLKVLTTQWTASAVLFFIGFFAMALPVWLSIEIAFRSRPVYAKLNSQLDRYQQVIEPLRRLAMLGVPLIVGLFAGVSAATHWSTVLEYLNRTSFGQKDPQFGLDASFYVFELPFFSGVVGFASAVILISFVGLMATAYLYGSIRVNGRQVRISRSARVQIAITGALYFAIQSVSIWLDQYSTLTQESQGFLTTGAGYTEANATIPARAILAGIALIVALLFLITAFVPVWRLPVIATGLLLVSGLVVGSIYPWIVQKLQVDPNAQSLEAKYIDRSITATRDAYGVSDVKVLPYNAKSDALAGALRQDAETTANIRIIDPALVSDSFAQLQRFKQYYQVVKHLDVDRYTIDGKTQDTVLAVRELNQSGLGSSQSWYNNTVVYTHGYGLIAAYGNQRTPDGQPKFLESDIPVAGALGTFEPRIYFGEKSPKYSIVGGPSGSKAVELDYPSAANNDKSNKKTTFDGNGGPKLDNFFTKLIYAIKFQSEQIVLSAAANDSSQILYDRDPLTRVSKVAPYLTPDSDPYPAVVDGRIVWIIDGYTTTANYPYSHTEQLSQTIADTYTAEPIYPVDDINYIRNSVKATVDAYDGSVKLYAWDTEDPMLKTWQKIFPSTVLPESDMDQQLLDHVRYPADLFKVQRAILGSYHVTDPLSFYSSDDQWVTPNDPANGTKLPTLQPPYYLTMQVPGTASPAFTLYSTYIPRGSADSTSNILTGYLTADSDAGSNYGDLTLLTLPKQNTVPGPGQVESAFTTDTNVAPELALLQRGNTTVDLGNLLTVPVGGGLLYVQPVYVKANSSTSYPLLRKVLVGFGDKIAFEDTLDAALNSIFGGDSGASAGDGSSTSTPAPTPSGSSSGSPSPVVDNPALDQALADAQKALAARTAAYKVNDLVAAAQADKDLIDALQRAIAASK
jgi:uncharacterized protein